MKKPIDSDIEQLWKAISIIPIDAIPSQYKEHGLASLRFEYKGQNYDLKLSKSVERKKKNKI